MAQNHTDQETVLPCTYYVEFADKVTTAPDVKAAPAVWHRLSEHTGLLAHANALGAARRFAKANRGAALKVRVRQDVTVTEFDV